MKKLPRHGIWEVDLIAAPDQQIADVELRGLFIAFDIVRQMMVCAQPVTIEDNLGSLLKKATTDPAQGEGAARPTEIRCRPALRFELNRAARTLGAKLVATDELPLVTRATEDLLNAMSNGPQMIPIEPQLWVGLTKRLATAAPWRTLSEDVVFRFPRAPGLLNGAVAVVTGALGEQPGLTIYPSGAHYERYLDAASRRDVNHPDMSCWAVHLNHEEDLPELHSTLAAQLDLQVGDKVLNVFALDAGQIRQLLPQEERACRLATQATLGAFAYQAANLLHRPTETRAQTDEGMVTVQTTINGREQAPPLLVNAPHRALLGEVGLDGESHSTMFYKAGKRDAQRMLHALDGVDNLRLKPIGASTFNVVAFAGSKEIGPIASLDADPHTRAFWRNAGHGRLVIAAGGARRNSLKWEHFLATLEVEFVVQSDAGPTPLPEFDTSWRDKADWSGPPDTWPKASTVLLDFMRPLGITDITKDELFAAATFASTVWSAVVKCDQEGDRTLLNEVTANFAQIPDLRRTLDKLVQRKRRLFAMDTRVMVVQSVEQHGDIANLQVLWTPSSS
jgi:hypothetical protein